MTEETLEYELAKASQSLIKLGKEICWNNISENVFYILSEIINADENLLIRLKKQNLENNKKQPLRLTEIISALKSLYTELYDINLYIYKSDSDKTIIDIRYYSKNSLDSSYRKKVANNPPMLHCKVSLPPSHTEGTRFDINWENQII